MDSFALNFKGLPMKTEWIEYPDIKALYSKLGLEVTQMKRGSPYYCLPVIHDPSTNTTLGDSLTIVRYLEKTYPNTPPLLHNLGTLALQKGCLTGFNKAHGTMYNLVVFPVWRILNERSQAHYRSTCEAAMGKKLEDICHANSWQEAEKAWSLVSEWLKLNGEGLDDLIMGDQVCYVDLQVVSILVWAKNSLGEDSEEWNRICSWSGGKWERYLDNFAKYNSVVDE